MRDYAKKSHTPLKKKNNSNGAGLLIALILCAIFLIGFAMYHLVHKKMLSEETAQPQKIALTVAPPIKQNPAKIPAKKLLSRLKISKPQEVEKAPKVSKKIKLAAIQDIPPIDNQPKYDFYKLLPQMTVVIPADDQSTAMPSKTTLAPHVPTHYYLLQIASLESEMDAKEMENTLKSDGYTAFIQNYRGPDKATWYRVMVGPIYNLKAAQVLQSKLYAHQMVAMLLKAQK